MPSRTTKTAEPSPPGLFLVVAAAAVTGLNFGLPFAKALAESSNASYALGLATGAGLAWPVIGLVLSQLSARFRNARGRYLVILVASLVVFGSQTLLAVLPTWRDALREKLARSAAATAPKIHFAELPKAEWTEKDLPPPDRQVTRIQQFTHAGGMKQIIVSTMLNPAGDTDLPPQLQGFKNSLSEQGFRFIKESPVTLGQTQGMWLVGRTDHGDGRIAHSLVLYAVNKQMVYSVIIISTTAPVVHDPELSAFYKTVQID